MKRKMFYDKFGNAYTEEQARKIEASNQTKFEELMALIDAGKATMQDVENLSPFWLFGEEIVEVANV